MDIVKTIRNTLNIGRALRNPPIRAKTLGILFIIMGAYFMVFMEGSLYLNIGIGAIFIGLFTFFMISEQTVLKKISDSQLYSNTELHHSLLHHLNVRGSAIYLPAGGKLSKERVFIPTEEMKGFDIPEVDDTVVFITGTKVEGLTSDGAATWALYDESSFSSGTGLGVVCVPPGFELLETFESELDCEIENMDLDELEKRLRIMSYGLDLIKDLSIKKMSDKFIRMNIIHSTHAEVCKRIVSNMENICKQTGCPICSSVLCALTRALGKKLRIQKVEINEYEVRYLLGIGE